MVHAYFPIFRAVFLSFTTPLTVAFGLQLYVERADMYKLFFESPRQLHARLVCHICMFLAALLSMVTGIDFYGAHNIYSPYTRVSLLAASGIWVPLALAFMIRLELRVAFEVAHVEPRMQRVMLGASSFVLILVAFFVVTVKFIDYRPYFVMSRITYLLALILAPAVINYVWCKLNEHRVSMTGLGMSCPKAAAFLAKTVKRWRAYAVQITILNIVFALFVIYELVDPAGSSVSMENINLDVDYTVAPKPIDVGSALYMLVLSMLIGHRTRIRNAEGGGACFSLRRARETPQEACTGVPKVSSVTSVQSSNAKGLTPRDTKMRSCASTVWRLGHEHSERADAVTPDRDEAAKERTSTNEVPAAIV